MKHNLALTFLATVLMLTVSAAAGVLDDTSWAVQATPTRQTSAAGEKPFRDVLTFSAGRVSSATLKQSGVGAVTYSVHGENGFYNWETAPVLKAKNAAEWAGVINGKNIGGNLKWFTRDGRVRYYTLKGRKQ